MDNKKVKRGGKPSRSIQDQFRRAHLQNENYPVEESNHGHPTPIEGSSSKLRQLPDTL